MVTWVEAEDQKSSVIITKLVVKISIKLKKRNKEYVILKRYRGKLREKKHFDLNSSR